MTARDPTHQPLQGPTLETLLAAAPAVPLAGAAVPPASMPVPALAVDSRKVAEGTVFVAVPGSRLDGADFVPYALRQGAGAIVIAPEAVARAERAVERPAPSWGVPVLLAEVPRRWLALAAAAFHGVQPRVIAAVTGTNGKTSTAHFLRGIWAAAGRRAASFGTTGVEGTGFEALGTLTTPEPIALHALLADLAVKGCTHAAMEASSHGLAQHRLDGVRLSAAALTNITRDHLDYHKTHAAYVAAKLRLFRHVLPRDAVAVLGADDPVYAEARAAALARGQRVIATGRSANAELRIVAQRFRPAGQQVMFGWAGRTYTVELGLVGAFQAENVATAAALAIATGVPVRVVFDALAALTPVRGRMELAGRRANRAAVYVDYAHTPGALASALASIRPHAEGRLICVFGAGGDRDAGKRIEMGRAVAERADLACVTDDNPRSEDPAAIRAAVMQGCPEAIEIGDRAEAILAGVDALQAPGDVLLIAGKGHEQGQEVAGRMLPFDDVSQAEAAIAALDGLDGPHASGGGA
ncbi:MAG: UDP-N-acetylmuramoyl-L-alanyl-D-glutamate--2,6-diaminopimelate ligase [Pseudomonadota bacterium]